MVCSMGSISVNIADNQVKINYAVSIMVLGSSVFMAGGQIPWCACGPLRTSVIGLLVADVVCCDLCFS